MPGKTSGSDAGPVSDSACEWSRGPIRLGFIDRVLLAWRPNHWCIVGWLIGDGGNTANELMKLMCKKKKRSKNKNLPHNADSYTFSNAICILLSRWILITLQENCTEMSVSNLSGCICRLVEVPVGDLCLTPLPAQLTDSSVGTQRCFNLLEQSDQTLLHLQSLSISSAATGDKYICDSCWSV